MISFENFFKHLTGFEPYAFQLRVAQAVFSDRDVLLVAQTGAGKTWATVAPFLYAKIALSPCGLGRSLADRLIYALPLRSLASSLHENVAHSIERMLGERAVARSAKDRDFGDGKIYITIQTGEQQEDPYFMGDVVFTTIDQLLSSYLNMPVSLPRRLSNINAGALVGAYIVLDEFHLLESDKSLSTAIEMIDRLKQYAIVVVMTATLSRVACERLAKLLDLEYIELSEEEREKLQSQLQRTRDWCFTGAPMNLSEILKLHKRRTIVMCNTVKRAQHMYSDLKENIQSNASILLLHSRFYPKDRERIEAEVIKRFGKEAPDDDSVILVTTQVIEAGMDISCDVLHTEVAPVNSLIQRAGRCARFGGYGQVYIYELPVEAETAPYAKELVDATRSILPREFTSVDYEKERLFIDAVHALPEVIFLDKFSIRSHRDRVAQAMAGINPGAIAELVRDIDNVNIIITDDPNKIEFSKDRWPVSLSVPRSSLLSALKDKESCEAWLAEVRDTDDESWAGLSWKRIESPKQVAGAWYVALHPNIATYTSALGFVFKSSGSSTVVDYQERSPLPLYSYRVETFKEHAVRSLEAYEKLASVSEKGIAVLASSFSISVDNLREISRALVALHDVGKLSQGWQAFAEAWQTKKFPNRIYDEPLAHTDFDPMVDRESMYELPSKPPHAAEGGFALGNWLFSDLGLQTKIGVAAISAVARHHSGSTFRVSEFELIDRAEHEVVSVIKRNISLRTPRNILECAQFASYLIDPTKVDHQPFLPLYWYLVRTIRLCDQIATKEVSIVAATC